MSFQNYYYNLGYAMEKQSMEKTANVNSEQLGSVVQTLGPAALGALIGSKFHGTKGTLIGGLSGLVPSVIGSSVGVYSDDAIERQKHLSKDFSLADLLLPGKAVYSAATRDRALADRLGYSE